MESPAATQQAAHMEHADVDRGHRALSMNHEAKTAGEDSSTLKMYNILISSIAFHAIFFGFNPAASLQPAGMIPS